MIRRSLFLTALTATVLALSACGDAGGGYGAADPYGSIGGSSYGAAPGPGAPSATAGYGPDDDAEDTGATDPVLAAEEVGDVGTALTDADGLTLYRFDEDTADPPTTTCVDACAKKWPPFVVDPKGTLQLDGVETDAVGLLARPDGTTQLTVGGWPVYRFADDDKAGDVNGEGVGGTWYAIGPDGRKASG